MRETGWPPNEVAGLGPIAPGTPVEVWNATTDEWADWFEVEGTTAQGYLIRRLSDHSVLPEPIRPANVRTGDSADTSPN